MTTKTTRRDTLAAYDHVLQVGYCNLQNLLAQETPAAYTAGVYGWNADVYDLGPVAIVTGYRPFGAKVNHDLCAKYDQQAAEVIRTTRGLPLDQRRASLRALLDAYITEALQQ